MNGFLSKFKNFNQKQKKESEKEEIYESDPISILDIANKFGNNERRLNNEELLKYLCVEYLHKNVKIQTVKETIIMNNVEDIYLTLRLSNNDNNNTITNINFTNKEWIANLTNTAMLSILFKRNISEEDPWGEES